jgi:hypothetical protein
MQSRVQKFTGAFFYKKKQIKFHFWKKGNSISPDTIIFLGTAQVGKIPKWVAQSSPDGVVIVEGIHHWEADPSGQDLKDFTINYTKSAFNAIFDIFKIQKINVVASSQGVPGVIWVSKQIVHKVRNIGLIGPLGYTPAVFGNSSNSRIKKLRMRALKSFLQFSQTVFHDPRNIYINFILLKALLLEKEWKAADRKYAAGLTSDLIEDTRLIAEKLSHRGNSFTIFLGEKDKVFPPEEVLSSLKKSGIKHIHTVIFPDMSHSSLAIRGNRKYLIEIINMVRK